MLFSTIRACLIFWVSLAGLLMTHCTNSVDDSKILNASKTTKLVQAVLRDKKLEVEISRDFGNQALKLVAEPFIKANQRLTFANKPVEIVHLSEDSRQIHEHHPNELYVSVPVIKLFSKDSAIVMLFFHAGNATALFKMKNDGAGWTIKEREYGKF